VYMYMYVLIIIKWMLHLSINHISIACYWNWKIYKSHLQNLIVGDRKYNYMKCSSVLLTFFKLSLTWIFLPIAFCSRGFTNKQLLAWKYYIFIANHVLLNYMYCNHRIQLLNQIFCFIISGFGFWNVTIC
jgi:hypothetical protein